MAKKRKKPAQGNARVKRAAPVPEKKSFEETMREKFGDNPPDGRKVGAVLGKAFAEMITNKVNSSHAGEPGLAAKAEQFAKESEPGPPDGEIVLRTPDSQLTHWTFDHSRPQDAGYDDDPLRTHISRPQKTIWQWLVLGKGYPRVNATYEWPSNDHPNGKYETGIDLGYAVTFLRGSAAMAKKMAEALLCAYDWEKSWPKVLGADISQPCWLDYSRSREEGK